MAAAARVWPTTPSLWMILLETYTRPHAKRFHSFPIRTTTSTVAASRRHFSCSGLLLVRGGGTNEQWQQRFHTRRPQHVDRERKESQRQASTRVLSTKAYKSATQALEQFVRLLFSSSQRENSSLEKLVTVVAQDMCDAYLQSTLEERHQFVSILLISFRKQKEQNNTDSIRKFVQVLVEAYRKDKHEQAHVNNNSVLPRFLLRLREDLSFVLRRSVSNDLSKEDISLDSIQQKEVQNVGRALDEVLLQTLRIHWFASLEDGDNHVGVLELRRITAQNTPEPILQKILNGDTVHPPRTMEELLSRLSTPHDNDNPQDPQYQDWTCHKRCYALFHPQILPQEQPLVFVHIALLPDIPGGMQDIEEWTNHDQKEKNNADENFGKRPQTVVFYSINTVMGGLQGLDLGRFLIKRLAKEFSLCGMDTFVTLSPIPKFRTWLREGVLNQLKRMHQEQKVNETIDFEDDFVLSQKDVNGIRKALGLSHLVQDVDVLDGFVRNVLDHPEKIFSVTQGDRLVQENQAKTSFELRPILMKAAARYLLSSSTIPPKQNSLAKKSATRTVSPSLEEDHSKQEPMDGVAKFHVRNGAEMYRLNYMADLSASGLQNSLGIMVNYRYPVNGNAGDMAGKVEQSGKASSKAREKDSEDVNVPWLVGRGVSDWLS